MQWSKLKSEIKSLSCPELQKRIGFHVTSYRNSHDGADKVWITVDGIKVFHCKHYQYEQAERIAYHSGLQRVEIKTELANSEIHNPKGFGDAMRVYLNSPIQDALQSADPLVKAYAVIDRQLGSRTLDKLEISDSEHSLVKTFYQLRKKDLFTQMPPNT
jgi:hypothetical protein